MDADHEADENELKAKEHHIPEGELVYRAIRQDGDDALDRRSGELAWSGLAAGLSMGFSFAAEGLLRAHLPESPWAPLITKFGYSVGFLIVVLGRQQLFTEQTLTAILPLLSNDRPQGVLSNVVRLWVVVLAANVAGTAAFAVASAWTPVFPAEVHQAFTQIGQDTMRHGAGGTLLTGIYAGFLIATMIWLLPGAGAGRLWIVILLTYVVGLGGFAHVIAGSAECVYLVVTGQRTLFDYGAGFLLPAFIGNALGGVALVATLAHAQHAPAESR
jgi:formate-nitrite transporter family protein